MFSDFFNGLKNYFHFTRKELIGFNVLSVILILFIFMPLLFDHFMPGKKLVQKSDYQILDSLVKALENENKLTTFYFDPNVLPKDSMNMLGLPDHVVENWERYRSSGGHFTVKSGFKRIYGLSDEQYYALEPFILLPDSISFGNSKKNEKHFEVEKMDINLAISEELLKINGIGNTLATRIIKYRDLLGGFVKTDQYDEVYHLSETASANLKKYSYIKSDFNPDKINVNEDDYSEILRHPYVSKELTDKIFSSRKNDSFVDTLVLKDLVDNDSVYFDLLPYIEF